MACVYYIPSYSGPVTVWQVVGYLHGTGKKF